jgi:hypothetical protein
MIVVPTRDFPAEKPGENLSLLQDKLNYKTMKIKSFLFSPQVLKNLCVTGRPSRAD